MERKTQTLAHMRTCMYLCTYVCVGIYYTSPSWHKCQELRSFVVSKEFSVQFGPAGIPHQRHFNTELRSLNNKIGT